ncbi:Uncharacterized conserved protein YeaO, DUF488 family [Nitrosovibrio sp. Nv17]|nr:Uncharacterized conserved protein YeaO, DUF488 family [Nitrosovibrio sp. Nv17]
MKLELKRAYDSPAASDGMRVLVDRLWPRGLSKATGRIDVWAKDIAPSADLRRWYGHEPEKWPEFRRRYQEELKANASALTELAARVADSGADTITLLFGAKDATRNNAVVLKEYLHTQLRSR